MNWWNKSLYQVILFVYVHFEIIRVWANRKARNEINEGDNWLTRNHNFNSSFLFLKLVFIRINKLLLCVWIEVVLKEKKIVILKTYFVKDNNTA